MQSTSLGLKGEAIAFNYLTKQGYKILEKNYRFGKNEIDIVAEHQQELIIVEVKTRSENTINDPWVSVTRAKQRVIIKTANQYIQKNNIDLNTRFDVISIIHSESETEIEHIVDAFCP